MTGQFQAFTGHYFKGEYFEWDNKTKQFKEGINLRFKPQDLSSRGVSAGVKEEYIDQNIQGRQTNVKRFTIQVLRDLPYKPQDEFYIFNENKRYRITMVSEGWDSINSLSNLQFPKLRKNKPYVLVLGER